MKNGVGNLIEILIGKTTYYKIQKIKELKLKWFQIRIIHRIIATNRSLKWMKVSNSELCSFCKEETENIEHLFWGCDIVMNFWRQLIDVLKGQSQVFSTFSHFY